MKTYTYAERYKIMKKCFNTASVFKYFIALGIALYYHQLPAFFIAFFIVWAHTSRHHGPKLWLKMKRKEYVNKRRQKAIDELLEPRKN